MGIISAELRALPQTGNPIFLNFDEKMNLFIGPNATGKTAILREMEKVFPSAAQGNNPTLNISEDFKKAPHLYIPAVRVSLGENERSSLRLQSTALINALEVGRKQFFTTYQVVIGGEQEWVVDVEDEVQKGSYRLFEYLYLCEGAGYEGVGLTQDAWKAIKEFLDGEMTFAALTQIKGEVDSEYGDLRSIDDDDLINHLSRRRLEVVKRKLFNHVRAFDGRNVEEVYNFFSKMEGDYLAPNRNGLTRLMNVAYLCAKQICPETIQGDWPHEIGSNNRRAVGIVTNDNSPADRYAMGALPLRVLSSGTQGTMLWIWTLAAAMATHYLWDSNWNERPAILLIDEIENHLHPTWQRRVIPALLDHFPGLQIFATTHSPFVVAGLKAGQVHLLRRDENGVTATTNTEDVIGWTADEILRNMMGVDDPTDDATAAAARELRQLRQEPPRTNPDDEARRQERMQELRQQVDRDLLAGGPMEAQRELFEQQFADVMKRYRQNQELNQENG